MAHANLSERERRVLEAVIQTYVESAEPAGSRTISRRFSIGVSPATIRNTMSDLEEKGYLFHPHTSAGRVPTDMAYRVYVDSLMRLPQLDAEAHGRLMEHLAGGGTAIEAILRRAAQVLGVLTQELGVVLGPRLEEARLQRLELIRISSEKLLMVLALEGGAARSIFVEVPGEIAEAVLAEVARVLNERLAGLTLREIRTSFSDRLRDSGTARETSELLNIFLHGADQIFDVANPLSESPVLLGQTSVLAEQPEFASGENLRKLLALTEHPEQLGEFLRQRTVPAGIAITIGAEHEDPTLSEFTVVTAAYQAGALSGVIGVIGPTRMPYEKVITLVTHTSRLITDLLQ
ncbi:MAG TPA: heat-inducible transcriptional repressor HrcA [Gemmatimonadaceae bacterium]|nr:heat-inducible transcriptional repressor HrcA [Gemmatimonadaceae bacterium]